HRAPGVRRDQLLGAAVDQLLAELVLQALHRQGDRRLRAKELLGRAREAALTDDGGNDLQGVKPHRREGRAPRTRMEPRTIINWRYHPPRPKDKPKPSPSRPQNNANPH